MYSFLGPSKGRALKAASGVGRAPVCFFAEPFPGTGLALDEESRTLWKALLSTAESPGEAATVALESDEVETVTPPASSSSELSSDEELDELESEDSGRGVFFACLRALASSFLTDSFSDPESEESESEPESELESESEESLESELESEDEADESDSDSEDDSSFLVVLAFLALGASLSEPESELESDDDSSLDSALRFTPADFLAAGAGVGAASSSSSSSASLSELEEEEGEEERAFWSFTALGASSISTSESLESLSDSELESALLSLSLSELELEEPFFSQAWKISSKDGAFFASALLMAFFNSFSKAVLVVLKPLLDRKEEIDARSCGGAVVVLLGASVWQSKIYRQYSSAREWRQAVQLYLSLLDRGHLLLRFLSHDRSGCTL